ncbi:hypothetical protein ACFLZD_01795 [Candidatus Neomarinimicrobiota bacterium]
MNENINIKFPNNWRHYFILFIISSLIVSGLYTFGHFLINKNNEIFMTYISANIVLTFFSLMLSVLISLLKLLFRRKDTLLFFFRRAIIFTIFGAISMYAGMKFGNSYENEQNINEVQKNNNISFTTTHIWPSAKY